MERLTSIFHGWKAVLFIQSAYLVILAGAACAPYPIPIRLGNVSLSNGKVARGMDLAVGEPEQNFAFIPQWGQNSILLYGTDGVCTLRGSDTWSKDGCTSFRGGSYDALASKTRKTATLEAFPNDEGWPDINPVADKMKLNSNLTLENLAMGIALSDWGAQGYSAMMGLGLGKNSTILGVLKSSGKIASRTWSFFWGRGFGMTSQMDGSVVFGGYDRAKVTGKRYTQTMTANSPQCQSQLVVTVSDLTINFANGTNISIFPTKSSAIATCINPSLPVMMRMPLDPYFQAFLDHTNNTIENMGRSLGYHYWNMRYPADKVPYDGALTISFSSGLKIRIPHEHLILPSVYLDEKTGETLVNGTSPDFLIDSMQDINKNDMAQLGWQFLASAYLQVNQEKSQFSLWAANPTSEEDIVAIDSDDKEVTDFCLSKSDDGNDNVDSGGDTPSSAPTPAPSPSTSTIPSSSDNPGPALSHGAIAGIAVGGVALAAILGIAWWLLKRKRSKASKGATVAMEPSVPPYELEYSRQMEYASYQDFRKTQSPNELYAGDVDTGRPQRYEMAG